MPFKIASDSEHPVQIIVKESYILIIIFPNILRCLSENINKLKFFYGTTKALKQYSTLEKKYLV